MICSLNKSTERLTIFSAVIEDCCRSQGDDRASVVRLDATRNDESQIHNFTSAIFSKFLNSTRTGSAHTQAGISIQTFLSSMVVSVVYYLLQITLFTILRGKIRCIYQTRAMGRPGSPLDVPKKTQCLFKRQLAWIPTIVFSPIEKYYERVGLDAYFFLRFLKTQAIFFLTLSMLNILILLPINYQTSMKYTSGEPPPWLDRMNISSLVAQNSNKLVFHMILGIFVVIWFHAFLVRELKVVHKMSLSVHQDSSSILLFEKIPQNLMGDSAKLISHLDRILPKAILDVRFLPKTFEKLHKLRNEVKKAEEEMDQIIMKLLLNAFFSTTCRESNREISGLTNTQHFWLRVNRFLFYLKTPERVVGHIKMNKSDYNWLSFFTLKFNSEPYSVRLYQSLEKATKRYEKASVEWVQKCDNFQKWETASVDHGNRALQAQIYLDKVFVKFSSMNEALAVANLLRNGSDHKWRNVHHISDVNDLVWCNIKISNSTLIRLRTASANLLGVLIIVGYVIPVAFIGLISQIPYLASLTSFNAESNSSRGSEFIREMMAGIVPVITLIFLTECVPFIFWWLSYLRCKKTNAEMQTDIQNWFFTFLFVHVFLVVTISSSLSIVIEKIVNNPVGIPTMLAHDLPKSSNFFCSFILVRALAYSGGNLLQIKELLFEFYNRLTIYTPRKRTKRVNSIPTIQWSSVYPIFSVLGCIGIVYSVISPLILPLSCLGFYLVMFSFKYLYEYQYNEKHCSGFGGRLYPSSLMQMYAGIYCMEFCMIGLFALGNCFKLCLCMILSLILTIVAHVQVYRLCYKRLYAFNFEQYYQNGANICTLGEPMDRRINFPFANGRHSARIMTLNANNESTVNERNKLTEKFHLELSASNYGIGRSGDILHY